MIKKHTKPTFLRKADPKSTTYTKSNNFSNSKQSFDNSSEKPKRRTSSSNEYGDKRYTEWKSENREASNNSGFGQNRSFGIEKARPRRDEGFEKIYARQNQEQKEEIGYGNDRRERSTLPMGAKVKPDRFKRPKEDKKKWVPKPTLERKEGKKSGLGKGEIFDRFGNKMAGAKKSFGETKFGNSGKFNKSETKPSKYTKDEKPSGGGKFKKDFAKTKTFDKPAAPTKKKFWR